MDWSGWAIFGLIAAGRPVHPGRLADRYVALTDVVTPLGHRA
jgi:hypothetical protein